MSDPSTRPYRPSNGTEDEFFQSNWCHRCERDRRQDRPCRILGDTFFLDVDDPGYPPEWVQDAEGWPGNPRCTAFQSRTPNEVRQDHPGQAPGSNAAMTTTYRPALMPADTPDHMALAWVSCMSWALGEPKVLAAYRDATGDRWAPATNPLDAAIDKACGADRRFIERFIGWANGAVWGPMDGDDDG